MFTTQSFALQPVDITQGASHLKPAVTYMSWEDYHQLDPSGIHKGKKLVTLAQIQIWVPSQGLPATGSRLQSS